MIIEFRVRNFRAFRGDALLSLVASPDQELACNNVTETRIKALPRLLRGAAVFGPNASGKSTLVGALALLRTMVLAPPVGGAALRHEPFRLDPATRRQPTELELTFLLGGVRHQYGCAFDSNRIVEEWLLVYPTARPQAWFQRSADPETGAESWSFSSHLKGGKDAWQKATRPDALFLAAAAGLDSAQLLPVQQWFSRQLVILSGGGPISGPQTVDVLRDPETRAAVSDLLAVSDFGISGVRLVPDVGGGHPQAGHPGARQPGGGAAPYPMYYAAHVPAQGHCVQQPAAQYTVRHLPDAQPFPHLSGSAAQRPQFRHQSGSDEVYFELDEESQGTQRFFHLAGPIIDILRGGKVLVVDELDNSIHPLLVRRIIGMFQDPERNPHGAQLVFTTHDTSLMDAYGLLRRDQIWFTEKYQDHASRLVPLTDYSPRKGEALARGYLSGRYGGVPVLAEPKPFAQPSAGAAPTGKAH